MKCHVILLAAIGLTVATLGCQHAKSLEELRTEGKTLFAQEKYKEARVVFTLALRQNASDRELLYLMGMAYRRDQMYDSALSYIRRVDLLYPRDRDINQALLEVSTAMNDWGSARSALQGLINLGAAPPKAWRMMADFWRRDDHPGNCYHFLKKALAEEPDDINLWIEAANLAAVVDSAQGALMLIDTAVAKFGPDDRLLGNRSTYLSMIDQYDSAEVILRSLLAKDTGSVQYKLNLAHVLSAEKTKDKKREALALYKLVQPKIDEAFKVDSLIESLEKELK